MNNSIVVNGLCKQYPNFSLKDVSFSVPSGSIVGFIGENGAGKTTTIKAILKVIHKDAGTISLLGQDISNKLDTLPQQVGVVYDESSFHNWLRPKQVLSILRNIFPSWDEDYCRQLIIDLGMENVFAQNKLIKTFSRGMKMKLSLIAAMAHRPRILILDEPTSGLDPVIRDEILDVFLNFISDDEHSILFSSHITSDIEKIADYLVFIHEGRVILNAEKDWLLGQYGLLHCSKEYFTQMDRNIIVGFRENSFAIDVLVNDRAAVAPHPDAVLDAATIDDIMLYTIRGKSA